MEKVAAMVLAVASVAFVAFGEHIASMLTSAASSLAVPLLDRRSST